jgi:hypothetical protein
MADPISSPGFAPLSSEDSARVRVLIGKIDNARAEAVAGWQSRQDFERRLQRRVYLDTPLPRDEINVWHAYLTFEQRQQEQEQEQKKQLGCSGVERQGADGGEGGGDKRRDGNDVSKTPCSDSADRCVMLFERCLVPCAEYPGENDWSWPQCFVYTLILCMWCMWLCQRCGEGTVYTR